MKKERVYIDPFADLGFAKVDLHRAKRKGFPEVVFCQGKTRAQIIAIAGRIYRAHGTVLLTRVDPGIGQALKKRYRRGTHYADARIFHLGRAAPQQGLVAVLTAGTADIPVAEEAAVTAEIMGNRVVRIYDVGVAGVHRLLAFRAEIEKARVLVVVAGMDGVLPSVVAGLFAKPVIAVPTSIGYGLNLQGITPLLTMLNSCSPGIAVVNIDNGFGAGYFASTVNQL